MTTIALYDTETNGLLVPKMDKGVLTPPMDKMHCLAFILQDTEAKTERRISCAHPAAYAKGQSGRGWERMPVADGLRVLEQADIRVAHNGQDFDERAIRLVYPWFNPKEGSKVLDTLLLSRLIYPDIAKSGPNSFKLPGNSKVRHGLREWGIRLGEHKGDYKGGWAEWSEEMQIYMEQDVVVLAKLFKWLMAQQPAKEASALEHEFAAIIRRQESRGFGFDNNKALTLLGQLTERLQALEAGLIDGFGEWWAYGKAASSAAAQASPDRSHEEDDEADDPEEQEKRRQEWLSRRSWGDVVIPTKTRQAKLTGFPDIEITRLSTKTGKPLKPYVGPPKLTYVQGAAYTPIKRVQFNPGSRTHVRQRLIAKYGWEPSKFTKGGKNSPPQPVVDDDVLGALDYPEAKLLAEYYLVLKRIGMIAAGKKAWIKVARSVELPNGIVQYRIHGRVNTNGAVTGRCTHSDPNLAQVPKNSAGVKQYPGQDILHGAACRDLFIAHDPYELVGFDGSSLELRMLAHFVSPWDKGEYAELVDNGKKELGTDPHSWMRSEIIGENVIGAGDAGRDNAKTAIYAFLYGAGNEKLGTIVIPHGTLAEKRELGGEIKAKVFSRFHALGNLQAAIEQAVEKNGYLKGLDGRILRVRKAHASLNTLLQSAGAIVMKKSLVLLDANLRAGGLISGRDYEFVANVHDEAQAEVLPDHVALYTRLALEAVPLAGQSLRVQCPLKAEVSPSPDHRPARSWKETH